jgi:hypothetical protein
MSFLFFPSFFYAQSIPDALSEVKKLINQQKNKDAQAALDKLLVRCEAEKNYTYHLKAQILKLKSQELTDETFHQTNIKELKAILPNYSLELQAITHQIIALQYLALYHQNLHKIKNLATSDVVEEDKPETWSKATYWQKINQHYLLSLKEVKLLEKASPLDYKEFLIQSPPKNHHVDLIYPHLLAVLSHEYVKFIKENHEALYSPSANEFQLDDPQYLSPSSDFIRIKINSNDSLNPKFLLLTQYQNIINSVKDIKFSKAYFHHERIAYVENQSKISEKEVLFERSLMSEYAEKSDEKVDAMLHSKWLQWIYSHKKSYLRDDIHEENYKAFLVPELEKTIKKWPNSVPAEDCQRILYEIKKKHIAINIENIIIPEKPFLGNLTYGNIDKAHIYVFPKPEDHILNTFHDQITMLNYLKGKKPLEAKTISLSTHPNFENQSFECYLNGLKPNQYLFVASDADLNEFEVGKDIIGYVSNPVHAIDYSIIQDNNGYRILLRNRETGTKLTNYTYNISGWSDRNNDITHLSLNDEINAEIKIGHIPDIYGFQVTVKHRGVSTAFPLNQAYMPDNSRFSTDIYTDRSLYRPKDTVKFKAVILIKEHDSKYNFYADKVIGNIHLFDANHQVVATLNNLKTNEFGAVDAHFVIPEDRLFGSWMIQVDGIVSKKIQVEQYKKPTFEISLEKPNKTFVIGDSINYSGKVKNFNGMPVSNVKVTVYAKSNLERRYCWWWFRDEAPLILGEFSALTDETGQFTVKIPTKILKNQHRLAYRIDLEFKAMDQAGETSYEYTNFYLSDKPVFLMLHHSETFNSDNKPEFKLSAINNFQQNIEQTLEINIAKLLNPQTKFLKQRLWPIAKQKELSPTEFAEKFPFDPYEDISQKSTWKKEKSVYQKPYLTSSEATTLTLPNALSPGYYQIEARTTSGKDTIRQIGYFEVLDRKSNKPNPEKILEILSLDLDPQNEQKALLKIHSQIDNLSASLNISQIGQHYNLGQNIKLKKGLQEISMDIEQFRALYHAVDLTFALSGFYQNRLLTDKKTLTIKSLKKPLDIKLSSFRDKSQPNEKELWTISLSNHQNIEVLASMYDASLDEIKPHSWQALQIQTIKKSLLGHFQNYNAGLAHLYGQQRFSYPQSTYQFGTYDLNDEELSNNHNRYNFFINKRLKGNAMLFSMSGMRNENIAFEPSALEINNKAKKVEKNDKDLGEQDSEFKEQNIPKPTPRDKNLSTAFFYPSISNDKDSVHIPFTMPNAIGKWKMMLFALDKSTQNQVLTQEITLAKPLMIVPNFPRFLRHKDKVTLKAKAQNTSEHTLKAQAKIVLTQVSSGLAVTDKFIQNPQKQITLPASGQETLSWDIDVPSEILGPIFITFEIEGKSGTKTYMDAEQNTLMVLESQRLVTETRPFFLRGTQTKEIKIPALEKWGDSVNTKLFKIEYTINPVFSVVKSLAYIEPNEDTKSPSTAANRLFSNALGQYILTQNPEIKSKIQEELLRDTSFLQSPLARNQDVKTNELLNTPWIRQKIEEDHQTLRLHTFFNENRMNQSISSDKLLLQKLQKPNGSFGWYEMMDGNTYSTIYVLQIIGKLKAANQSLYTDDLAKIYQRAQNYLEDKLWQYYLKISQKKPLEWRDYVPVTAYIYQRSYWAENQLSNHEKEALTYFIRDFFKENENGSNQITHFKFSQKAELAVGLRRLGFLKEASLLDDILRQNEITKEEFGTYWKESYQNSYFCHAENVLTNVRQIENLTNLKASAEQIDLLKLFILKNKQTTRWHNSQTSLEAVYALMLTGSEWTKAEVMTKISTKNSNWEISTKDKDYQVQKYYEPEVVDSKFGSITVASTSTQTQPSWGGVYWQFYQDLDKIESNAERQELKIFKQLFKATKGEKGEVLTAISAHEKLSLGDEIVARLVIESDRNFSFVHVQDLSAAAYEPKDKLSGYYHRNGVWYYTQIQDDLQDYFIEYLPKGRFVLDRKVVLNNAGVFQGGNATIQSYYAPEFSAHSSSDKIHVK